MQTSGRRWATLRDNPAVSAASTIVRVDGPRQWLRFRRDEVSAADLVARVAQVAPVRDLTIEEPDVEDVVKRIYRGERDVPGRGVA